MRAAGVQVLDAALQAEVGVKHGCAVQEPDPADEHPEDVGSIVAAAPTAIMLNNA
jgi:hypothetical protein